jgi:hypothetical protein
MLSADITGQVRARLAKEQGDGVQVFDDAGESKISQVFHQGLVPSKAHSSHAFDDDWESVAGKVMTGTGNWESDKIEGSAGKGQEDLQATQSTAPASEEVVAPRNPTQHIIGREPFERPTPTSTSISRPASPQASSNVSQSMTGTSWGAATKEDKKGTSVAVAPTGATAIWTGELGPVVAFLVSYDEDKAGEVCLLRTGRMIVSSSLAGDGNIFYVPHKTVSAMHAILRMNKLGDIQILDQLSEHGTKIVRGDTGEISEISGEKASLFHGDTVHFGERRFYVCVVFRPLEDEL